MPEAKKAVNRGVTRQTMASKRPASMADKGRDIIVIGASAGGLEALGEVIGRLPAGLPASIFIVQHMPPESIGEAMLSRLGRCKSFNTKLAEDGEPFKRGRIYVAPPDSHLLLGKTKLRVTKGARENRYRPAIDPLFRSAAVAHGPRVIGVILTGMLDDGTAGLIAIQKCGGVTVVQDPNDAVYPDMPQSALNNADVDYCVPVAAMGALLEMLAREHPGKNKPVPTDVRMEAEIAERVLGGGIAKMDQLGSAAPYNCPTCGGALWEMDSQDVQRYRCHTGHSFTSSALLLSQWERIEETLWTALRMFEERKNLLNASAKRGKSGQGFYSERARETDVHIERIRSILFAPAEQRSREPGNSH